MMKKVVLLLLFLLFSSCKTEQKVLSDTIFHEKVIYSQKIDTIREHYFHVERQKKDTLYVHDSIIIEKYKTYRDSVFSHDTIRGVQTIHIEDKSPKKGYLWASIGVFCTTLLLALLFVRLLCGK